MIGAALAVFAASLALSLVYVGGGGSTKTPASHQMPDGSMMEDGMQMDGDDMGGMSHG